VARVVPECLVAHSSTTAHGELELESLGEDTEHFIRDVAYPISKRQKLENRGQLERIWNTA